MNYNLDDLYFWWYDELVREWLIMFYWPYFLAGNIDDLMSAGLTLNGIRPASPSKA